MKQSHPHCGSEMPHSLHLALTSCLSPIRTAQAHPASELAHLHPTSIHQHSAQQPHTRGPHTSTKLTRQLASSLSTSLRGAPCAFDAALELHPREQAHLPTAQLLSAGHAAPRALLYSCTSGLPLLDSRECLKHCTHYVQNASAELQIKYFRNLREQGLKGST